MRDARAYRREWFLGIAKVLTRNPQSDGCAAFFLKRNGVRLEVVFNNCALIMEHGKRVGDLVYPKSVSWNCHLQVLKQIFRHLRFHTSANLKGNQ
jgi:hypothetical protein